MNYFLTAFFIHFFILILLFRGSASGSPSTSTTVEIEIKDSGKVLLPNGKQGKSKSEDTVKTADKGPKKQKDNKPPGVEQKGPPVDMSLYANKIKSKVDPVWYRNIQDYRYTNFNTEVFISLDKYGKITNVSLFKSSGNRRVDEIAVETIREVGSFPPPPENLVTEGIIWSFTCGR